jgi:muramoyltetrapeptide carboxypeptidase
MTAPGFGWDRIRLTGASDRMTPVLPPPVRAGDRVGVAALSGPVAPDRLAAGLSALRDLGFEPVPARNLVSRHDLFAGDDALRLAALHELADDDSLAAIVFARGGHGVLRLLPEIDLPRLTRRPRAWVGYSDLTPLLNAMAQRAGLVAFHGPMVAADLARGLAAQERASFLAALAGDWPQLHALTCDDPAAAIAAEGETAGGCLSLLTATLGTPWQCDLNRKIVLLEDVDEPSYRIDRMLTHLGLSGSLAAVRGVVLGDLRGSDEATGEPSRVAARVRRVAPGAAVWQGLEIGHRPPNRTLPIGLAARIDPVTRTLAVGLDLGAR